MMRWSLRRRRLRTGNANPYTSRPDTSRRGAHRLPSDGTPRGLPPADGHSRAAEGYPADSQPGLGSPAGSYPRGATFTPVPGADAVTSRPPSAWPEICEQFSLHLLTLVEQLRMSLDELEADEPD